MGDKQERKKRWRAKMGFTMNVVMTSFGFAVSAIFIIFVLTRLLCARFRSNGRRFRGGWLFGVAADSIAVERGANGMDLGAISLLPTIKYSQEVFTSVEDAICTICLIGYEEREILRILPQCGHTFHIKCINAWLRQQSTCPICRIHLQSSPLQRNMPSPLLSTAARSRFSPGAIPESFFGSPVMPLSSPASTLGENSPRKCEICNNFQACNCDADALTTQGQHMCIDLQSLTRTDKVCLEEEQFGEASQSPIDDDLWYSRGSLMPYCRTKPGHNHNSCCQIQEDSRDEAKHDEAVEEKSSGVEEKDIAGSSMVEKSTGATCIFVRKYEPKQASDLKMAAPQTGWSIEGEASLCKQQGVQEDHIGPVNDGMGARDNSEQERYSFNLWIGEVQQGSLQQISGETLVNGAAETTAEGKSEGVVLGIPTVNHFVEAETKSRPEDVILGWTPAIYQLSSNNGSTTRRLDPVSGV